MIAPNENRSPADGRRSEAALRWGVVLLAVGFPRLMAAGGLPTTDEGVYAYYAQIHHARLAEGSGLADAGPLTLYPILLSWLFAVPANHLVLLRLADMAVALAAGALFYRVLREECRGRAGAALVAFPFLFTMSSPLFVQTGFKNSIFAAYVPLFLALLEAGRNGGTFGSRYEYRPAILPSLSILKMSIPSTTPPPPGPSR